MRLSEFSILADQNVREPVVEFLRASGFALLSAREGDLPGSSDEVLYALAVATGRVIVTHDRDFGRLAILGDEHPPGIVYLRPGHLNTDFTIDQLRQILAQDPNLEPPFMLVADLFREDLRVRIRSLKD